MIHYFTDDRVFSDFREICLSWIPTPFLHMAMVKGRGADCSTFMGAVFLEAKIITKIEYDYYPTKWYQSNPDFLLQNVKQHFIHYISPGIKVVEVPLNEDLYRGDVILLATWKKGVPNHAAIYLGNDEIIHTRPQSGTEIRPFQKSWFSSRLENIFRVEVI